jgi:hypothetical protein
MPDPTSRAPSLTATVPVDINCVSWLSDVDESCQSLYILGGRDRFIRDVVRSTTLSFSINCPAHPVWKLVVFEYGTDQSGTGF